MARLKQIFAAGLQDKESAPSFIRQGFFRHAENLRFTTNDGNDGEGKNIKGTTVVSNATDGNTDFKCICAYFNGDVDCIYYYLATTTGLLSKVIEYNIGADTTTTILHDTNGVLNLDKNGYITGINEIDGLLYWVQWGAEPRVANIARAKAYGTNGYTADDLKVIKRPPIQKIRTTLQNTVDNSQEENYIEDIFVSFSYRYRYIDGEYSVLAPFTLPQFLGRNFNYDYSEQTNKSMVNRYNQVLLEFFTGDDRVSEIQLVWKESESNNVWIIDDFNKSKLGYSDNAIESFTFDNNKTYRALSEYVIRSFFDNIPKTAKGQEMIDRRLFYANFLESYDLVDSSDNPIEIDYTIDVDSTDNTSGTVPTLIPKKTVKSNRDYEISIAYLDEDARMTTLLNSKTNTFYIEAAKSIAENKLKVILAHKPPKWAKYFRFFIKQNKKGYDQILPVVFYRDGVYAWLKLEGNDADKLTVGDFVIVKSDTSGPLTTVEKTKVLEIKEQDENFLESVAPDPYEVLQKKGTYFKIKTSNFSLNPGAIQIYDSVGGGFRTRTTGNDIGNNITYVEEPIYYNFGGLDDITITGTYSNADDIRYEIEIFTQGTPDTFRWREYNVVTDTVGSWNDNGGLGIDITGAAQTLSNGLSVTFGATTGHDIDDRWIVGAKSLTRANTWDMDDTDPPGSFGRRAIVMYMGKPLGNESIKGGAQITINYDDDGSDDGVDDQITFSDTFTSTQDYANIEEWFYGDNIISQLTYPVTLDRVMFRRGTFTKIVDGVPEVTSVDPTKAMVMLFLSSGNFTGGEAVRVDASLNITELDNNIIVETEPKRQQEDLYFEIGKTYKTVQSGGLATFHSAVTNDFETQIPNTAGDVTQTAVLDLEVTLDWFNAFCYGNGVESYKIRDDFGTKGMDVGSRSSTTIKDVYKEVHRKSGITWSDVYDDEVNFNGLSSFNLSLANFIDLDKENGAITKLHSLNGDMLTLQEDAIGILPVNKRIITDATGTQVVEIATEVLDRFSYRPYANGKYGCRHPESFVQNGSRNYFIDQQRGSLIRLANDGITTLEQYYFKHYFSKLMLANKSVMMVGGYDATLDEYLLHIPSLNQTIAFKEGGVDKNGFPNSYTFEPDFILNANNDCYAWKNGVMYKLNDSNTHNNFFGVQYESKIKFYFNQEFSVEKIWHAMSIEGTHPWDVLLSTDLASRSIAKEFFLKKEDHWYAEIMGNTNGDTDASNIFGLGSFAITAGEILTSNIPSTLSVGDTIISSTLPFAANPVTDIQADRIVLQNSITEASSFLMYQKNQSIDGTNIRGNILEVEMTSDETEEVVLRAVNTEISKSFYS